MPARSDWIDHDGQGAPDLPPGTRVQVRFRGQNNSAGMVPCEPFKYSGEGPGFLGDWWSHQGEWYDIIAYRVVRDEQ